MGFWTVESFGSLSKKELAKKPVCGHCGKPAKFVIDQVERDYDMDVTDAESYPICRACARARLVRRAPRAQRRYWKLEAREEEARRNALAFTNPELLHKLDKLGVSI